MRRVLAVAAAAGMVFASIAIRDRLDRRDEEESAALRLTCSTELAEVCEALREDEPRLEVQVESAGETADRLSRATGDAGLDGWLVPEPWPDIVDARRSLGAMPALFERARKPLARSPLVLVVWQERGAALREECGGPVNWKCLGDAAAAGPWTASGGNPGWGRIEVGLGDPGTDSVSLLVLGQAVAGYFGRSDLSTADLDDEDDFPRWFSALGNAAPPSGTSLAQMLAVGPAGADATGTTEAEAGPLLEDSPGRAPLDLLYPSPMATADVSLATTGTGPSPPLLRRLATGEAGRRALAGRGWRVPGEKTVKGVPDSPPLPPTTGLPSAGLLDNLRHRWLEATGR